ncbi:ArsA family ATPase [Vulgatibacter sp.]|uniref:ArsA family ATPase n=1 Tax=Vulgatibacter sp. TaxID=1971226 RepID=UPI00356165E4
MLSSLIDNKRVVVCSGAGGVGKTTTSAAIALAAARQGRRAVVLTIDPARRLADALGMPSLPSEPAPVPRELLDRAGVPPEGELHALMLDPKQTFDGLVRRLNPPDAAKRILENRLYQQISQLLAGMQEYTAEEKLHELAADDRFDVVVIDTPPTRNALDFLEAPGKLTRFLDERVLKWFLPQQQRWGFGILQRTGKIVGSVLERIFGEGFASELQDFLATLGGMTTTLRQHAEEVRQLLASPGSTFLLVTAPESASLDDAVYFRSRLDELGLPFGGYVVNRLHPQRPAASAAEVQAAGLALAEELPPGEAAKLLRRLEASYERERARADRDRQMLDRLRAEGKAPLVGIPRLEGDISDVAGLALLVDSAFSPGR